MNFSGRLGLQPGPEAFEVDHALRAHAEAGRDERVRLLALQLRLPILRLRAPADLAASLILGLYREVCLSNMTVITFRSQPIRPASGILFW